MGYGKRLKKILLMLSLCCFGLCSCSGSCSAEQMYQITPAELAQLESNLAQLASINQTQLATLSEQKGLLKQASFDLAELQDALKDSKAELSQAQSSLATANELLSKYAKEEQRKRAIIKRQRNFAYGLAGCLLVGIIWREVKR